MTKEVLEYVKRIQAMAKVGLSYTTNPYDIERYEELKEISEQLILRLTDSSLEEIRNYFSALDDHYPTPKTDVRVAVFENDRILLIKETSDGKWAMPGGWCDVGLSPSENAVKEVKEETGLEIHLARLLAVWDKKCHDHPPTPVAVYKYIFLGEVMGGELSHGFEATDQGFFSHEKLPPLSEERNTRSQIEKIFELRANPQPTVWD